MKFLSFLIRSRDFPQHPPKFDWKSLKSCWLGVWRSEQRPSLPKGVQCISNALFPCTVGSALLASAGPFFPSHRLWLSESRWPVLRSLSPSFSPLGATLSAWTCSLGLSHLCLGACCCLSWQCPRTPSGEGAHLRRLAHLGGSFLPCGWPPQSSLLKQKYLLPPFPLYSSRTVLSPCLQLLVQVFVQLVFYYPACS